MLQFSSHQNSFVKRTVKHVHEDNHFIYDLVEVDDEVAFKHPENYDDKQVIDIKVVQKKRNLKLKLPDVKEHVIGPPQKRGRKKIPRMEDLPMKRKRGRPNLNEVYVQNQYFGAFQAFKSIITNDQTRSSRLVILTQIKSTQGAAKYSCREVSSFYLPRTELDKIRDLSWTIIKKFQLSYCNVNLNLSTDYVLPRHFVDQEYYSEKNIALRNEKALRTQEAVERLNTAIEKDLFEIRKFINDFDRKTKYIYIRNTITDEATKARLFRILKTAHITSVDQMKPEDFEDFDEYWKEAYDKIDEKKEEFFLIMDKLYKSSPEISRKVKQYIFRGKALIDLNDDSYSLVEVQQLMDEYKLYFNSFIEKRHIRMTEEKRKEFKAYIKMFRMINQQANANLKLKLIKSRNKDINSLNLKQLTHLMEIWKESFDEEVNRMEMRNEKRRQPADMDELELSFDN